MLKPKGAKRETSLIESFLYPKKGPGQLWETLADAVRTRGGEVRLDSEIVRIETAGNAISALVTAQGERIP